MSLKVNVNFPLSSVASAAVAAGVAVRRYEHHEHMSELFELTVEALSPNPALDERAFVGQPILVDFLDEAFVEQVAGIVRRMEQRTAVLDGASLYVWTVVPPLWLTTRRRDCRIFQNKSVPEIVDDVLTNSGYAGRIPLPAKLLGEYPPLEYVVQYDETDWEFISRILADAGIASFFDHANGSAWTLVDDTTELAPDVTEGAIPFTDVSRMNTLVTADLSVPHVLAATVTSGIETSALTIRDYDFEKSDFLLQAQHRHDGDAVFTSELDLESYGFEVGRFTVQGPGDGRARALLEASRSPRRRVCCATSFVLPAGTRMQLCDHPREDLDASFLVVRVHATVDAEGTASRELELMDLGRRFRPARRPKRRIHGTQTAVVVGAPGEEIDIDKYGRVEVEFRWDRRDLHHAGASRRVRVAQGWAGAGFGFVAHPRVGDEVVVAYLDGDPDQPIIVGRVHNAQVAVPYGLPGSKTVTSWRSSSSPGGNGFNEIMMDDSAGSEQMGMTAQKDFSQSVGNDATRSVVGNDSSTVKGNQSSQVVGDQSEGVKGDKSISAKGALSMDGKTVALESTEKMRVSSGDFLQIWGGTNRQDFTCGNHQLDALAFFINGDTGVLVNTAKFHVYAEDEIHLQVGGSAIHITPGGIQITSPGEVKVNGSVVKLNC